MKKLVDLHVHSTFSDGVCTPQELVSMAKSAGLTAIAIADHDTVAGVDQAITAGIAVGVEVLPAIEFSVEFKGYRDVHLLGYCLDHRDPILLDTLDAFREKREKRGGAIVERLNEKLRFEGRERISQEAVSALAGGSLGRPHIAQILIRQGLVKDMQEAFVRYLIPCDVPKRYFPIAEAIDLIRRLHGAAVLAHPMHITKEHCELVSIIDSLVPLGLDGIESWHNGATANDSAFLSAVAEKRGLICTGGSDFHGIEEGVAMGIGRGELQVGYESVALLKGLHEGRLIPGAPSSPPPARRGRAGDRRECP
ncbi:PHP domain-containing protein [Geomonas sp. RF6]|uniref:PHP domain-containing protein n=1 Tax=Geomonas sp. RF6 TaxID=2897342 RepID=UPI001E5DBC77|nr:PHP domain-containing protein [Geomonas sp. RF6]UFS69835.1 PHP domain-containing protein [Geomonas sp. RF6]